MSKDSVAEKLNNDDEEIKDKKDAIKALVTRICEIDDQLDTLRQEKNDMKKEFIKKFSLDGKLIAVAISAVKKQIDGNELADVMESIEPIIK